MTIDTAILERRSELKSCRVIAEELGIPEHTVWSAIRRNGRCGEFRAKQKTKEKRSEEKINLRRIEATIRSHGELLIDETMDGQFIASFGDVSGKAKPTISGAIEDATKECRE